MIQQHSNIYVIYCKNTKGIKDHRELAKLVVSSVFIDDERQRKKKYFPFLFNYCMLVN